jgi:cation diffusion facilitator family transporter
MMEEHFMNSDDRVHLKKRLIAIGMSLLVGAGLMGLKFYVYWMTGSSAILSDALESIINVVASAFALGSILLSAKPPDPSHPYGHGKIEYFSAGFEGALIIIAAIGIVHAALPQILHPTPLPNLESGLLILLGASLANLILGLSLTRVGKNTQSLALVADGKHLLTDVFTSAGVLAGLVLVNLTGWYWLDGAIACVMAISILFTGLGLVRQSFAGLMDASDPELLEQMTEILAQNRRDIWIDVHNLRAWRSGNRVHVDLHLILPKDLSLEEAYKEVVQLQKVLKNHIGTLADVLIHAEPCLDPCCERPNASCPTVRPATSCDCVWYRQSFDSLSSETRYCPTDGGAHRCERTRPEDKREP